MSYRSRHLAHLSGVFSNPGLAGFAGPSGVTRLGTMPAPIPVVRNFDYPMPYQGKMAKSALAQIQRDAGVLRRLLQDGDVIPQWNHYKIATAAHDVAKVRNYLQYKIEEDQPGAPTDLAGSAGGAFRASVLSDYGEGEAAPAGDKAASSSASTDAMIQEYAPLVKTGLEQVLDPTQQQEVLRARIKNTQKMIKRAPPLLRGPLQARLRVLKAKLKAAERRVELQREQESARRTWRTLGQVTVVGGVLLLLGLTARFVRRQRATG